MSALIVRNNKYVSPKAKKLRSYFIKFLFVLAGALILAAAGLYFYLVRSLPSIESLTNYRPSIVTKVYSDDGVLVGEFFVERREVVPLDKLPKRLVQAFISAEDGRFYKHEGLDFFSIFRAFIANVREGEVTQGGSTITQQVAKSLLTPERTLERKAREAILSYRLERNLTKDEILNLYLNHIYLGHGAYGVQAAAVSYFRKNVAELDLAEMAILAGLPQAPSRYSPAINPEKALERQSYVLNRMVDDGYINIVEATDAMNTELKVHPVPDLSAEVSPYFTEHVRRYLEKTYGMDMFLKEGLIVRTTLDFKMQKAAMKALEEGLLALDKRQGYRGALRHLSPDEEGPFLEELESRLKKKPLAEGEVIEGVVAAVNSTAKETTVKLGKKAVGRLPLKEMRWARKPDPAVPYYEVSVGDPAEVLTPGDVILLKVAGPSGKNGEVMLSLHQYPIAQGAVLAIDPHSGFIKAMVGGRDFNDSKFNRTVQSLRQPGSAFKPIVYAAAVEKGYTPSTIVSDTPFVYRHRLTGMLWEPKNYDGEFHGAITVRKAIAESRNMPVIRVSQDIGIDYLIAYARRLGISSWLARDLSLSLGSSALSLMELTSAYGIFPAGGKRVQPVYIREIRDRDGKVLERFEEGSQAGGAAPVETEEKGRKAKKIEWPASLKNLPPGYVISPQTAYIMTSLLRGVVQDGTGWKVKVLNRPIGGKTGTTDENRDAWFIGFTPDLVAGAWVGFDDRAPLGAKETGGIAAAPIFVDFMKDSLEGKPVLDFPVPEGVVRFRVDKQSGRRAPTEMTEGVVEEFFKKGTAPGAWMEPAAAPAAVPGETVPVEGDIPATTPEPETPPAPPDTE